MTTRVLTLWAIAVAVLASACTLDQTAAPLLTGPSDFARSVTVTATPDSIHLGNSAASLGQSSTILVKVFDESGNGVPNVDVRLDILIGSTFQDCGELRPVRIVKTATDGTAISTYWAPGNPMPFPQCSGFNGTVTIQATPVGTDFQGAVSRSVSIELVPLGVILPPPGTPTPAFTFAPTPVTLNLPIIFDASASTPGANALISSYNWSFGDGSTASGVRATHAFTSTGTFTVTLTVINDRGISAATTQSVTVTASAAPTGDWVFSPTSPVVNTIIQFNAEGIQAAPGHRIDEYNWNFGDGTTPATGVLPTHAFAAAGTYNVVLTVTDNTGVKATFTKSLTVGTGKPVAVFTMSPVPPVAPGTTINFDGSGSTAATGASISTYTWLFGDGAGAGPSSSPATSHSYALAGTYVVTLTVTDNLGRIGTNTQTVKIQ